MRLWASTVAFLGAGALLLWFGAAQFDDLWPRNVRTMNWPITDVDTSVVPGRPSRFAIHPGKLRARFEIPSAILPHPTAAALMDAASVVIEYDAKVRLRPNPMREPGGCVVAPGARVRPERISRRCQQYEVYYYVTGLAADGRVSYSSGAYKLVVVLWVALSVIPGAILFFVGANWLYRLVRFGHVYRLRGRRLFSPVRGMQRLSAASAEPMRDRRKTPDGQWLH